MASTSMSEFQERLRVALAWFDGDTIDLTLALRRHGCYVTDATVRHWIDGAHHPYRRNEHAALTAIAAAMEEPRP